MTDTPTPTRPSLVERATAAFRSITLAQAIVVAAIVGGTIYAFQALPDERLQWLIATLGTLGGIGTLALSPKTSETTPAPSAPPPPPVRNPRRDGSSTVDAMLWALAIGAALWAWAQRAGWIGVLLLATWSASGCGAGAIAAHARAATVATVALEGVAPMIEAEAERRAAECGPQDTACVEQLTLEMAPWLADADAAVISIRTALTSYVTGIRLVLDVGDDDSGAVITALATGAARLLGGWSQLAVVLARRGIELPLPPLLDRAAAGGAL